MGKKLGMTNVFDQEGRFIPVTLIEAGPCFVLGARTKEKEGYTAVILGYGEKKSSKVKTPQKKWFDKIKVSPKKIIKEIRVDDPSSCKVGDKVDVSIFKTGDYVDVTGTTIGKGFQGGLKRWHWSGGESGHGSMHHRAPGSIGGSSDPSRVFKGQHMPGHMGAVKKTMQSLEVMGVERDKSLLTVKGSVPGHKGSFLFIRHAKKKKSKRVPGTEEKKDEKTK